MPDNPLKAIVDSIAEADNEIGGQLVTRLRQAHRHGGNDGELAAADPDRLTSKTDVFESGDVGLLVDVLEADTPTGNEGTYEIATYVDAKNVDVVKVDGSGAPTFVDEDPIQWRFASLRVESTYQFPERDHLQRLYVGTEADPVPYAALVQTPGAQEFLGLGEHRVDRLGATLRTASPQTLVARQEFFTASDVGKALWILPAATANGNEGPRVISAYTSAREVDFTGAAIAADEDDALYLVKTYAGTGYLTTTQRELAEVVDGSRSWSALDKLWRSLCIDLAVEEEIDRIARRFGLVRPRSLVDDEIWRRVVIVRAYLAASPVYSLELMLNALFPEGGWSVEEDLSQESLTARPRHANEVFIQVPDLAPGDDFEGRTFLDGPETVDSTSTTTVTVGETPTTVHTVHLAPVELTLDMDVLPSAESTPWTYQAESSGAEGTFFSVQATGESWTPTGGIVTQNVLQQVADNPGTNSGRYYRTISEIDTAKPTEISLEASFILASESSVGGKPWQLVIDDGEYEYALLWDDTDLALGQSDGTEHNTVALAPDFSGGDWSRFRIRRSGETVYAYQNGVEVMSEAIGSFSGSSAAKQLSFGYYDNGSSQNWTAKWDDVRAYARTGKNYWNLYREDGALATSSDVLTSAAGLFVSGDTGKRVFLDAINNENWGLWNATYTAATQLTLSAIEHTAEARVYTDTSDGDKQIVELDDPDFNRRDIGKDVIVSGSTLGNDRTVTITAIQDEKHAEVSNPGADFVDEDGLNWEFDVAFVTETSIPWELVDAASNTGAALTLRDALPASPVSLEVGYTTVLSAQVLQDSFVSNLGTAPDLYYPFYLLDVDEGYQQLIDMVTAAGVIPRYGVTPD